MNEILRKVWWAVRPVDVQQRFVWWCGTLLIASGLVHAVVAVVDGGSWWGPVSWRKPTVFGLSFGILLWSVVWIMRQLSRDRWVRLPAVILGATGIVEVGLVTMQRWRGVPSHFYRATGFDAGVWSAMGITILVVPVTVSVLLIAALVRFRGTPAARVAVVAGLAFALAAGYIGKDMARMGESVLDATGHVPYTIVFGAAGSPKLAHALGLHGIQVLGLIAIGLEMGGLAARARMRVMLLAVAGFASLFAAVTVTAYTGRAWTAPALPMAVLSLAGVAGLLVAAAITIKNLSIDRTPVDRATHPRAVVVR